MGKTKLIQRISETFRASKRRPRVRRMLWEGLESRHLMAVDWEYTLQPRPGIDVAEVSAVSTAANENFHVVGRSFRGYVPNSSFAGEVQIHDANTGNLLRTIANPEPELLYRFGVSVDVDGNRLLVGTTGRGEDPEAEIPEEAYSDPTGKAYLFDMTTGDLLHTFEGSYAPDVPFDPDFDQFGESVAVFGNYVVVGAPGKSPFDSADENGGHVFVYNAQTGSLLYTLENPGPYDRGDFGQFLSVYDDKLVISDPFHTTGLFGAGAGIVYVYDVVTGQLETTLTRPVDLELSQFGQGVDIYENTVVVGNEVGGSQLTVSSGFVTFDATTGVVIQKVITDIGNGNSEQLLRPRIWDNVVAATFMSYQASDVNRPVARLYDAMTGGLLETVTAPVSTPLLTSGLVTVFQDRLLVSQFVPQYQAGHSDVHVYRFDTVVGNPPTDLALSGNSVVEHANGGTVIGSLTATDPDVGDSFTYALTDSAGGRFGISGSNLVVNQSALVNFETDPAPSVTVMVTDSTGEMYSEVFVIQITDINDSPTDITISNDQVVENATTSTPIGQLAGVDEDAGETFSFALISDAGGRIGLIGSILVVANGGLLDYEQATSHAIVVQVTDGAGSTFTRSLTIEVVNVSDSAPTDILLLNRAVVEHAKVGTIVASFESPTQERYGFGQFIASGGDYLVAAEATAPGGGRVQVLDPADGSVIRTITNPDPSTQDAFGSALAASEEYLVIGNPKNDDHGSNAGKAYVYDASTGALLHELSDPAPAAFQEFGSEVAVHGNRILVGRWFGNGGVIHVFNATTGLLQQSIVRPSGASLNFGRDIALEGNLVAIGDRGYVVNGESVGRVYLFNATTGNLVQVFENPEPSQAIGSNSDSFGAAVAFSPGRLVVAAPGQDQGGKDVGVIYVFNVLTGDLLQTLTTPNVAEFGFLGGRMVVEGTRIAATVNNVDPQAFNGGRVHLFDMTSGSHLASLVEAVPQASAFFGSGMAFAGGNLHIGTLSQYGQIEVFRSFDGARRVDTIAIDPDSGDTFTFQLLDDAGGRFALVDNHLVVANRLLINYEEATSHTIVMQVIDSTGLSFQKSIVISVLDTQEFAPADLLLRDRYVQEGAETGTRVALYDNPTPYAGESFGDVLQVTGKYVLGSDSRDHVGAGVGGSVHMLDAVDGRLVRTLTSPNASSAEQFGTAYGAGQFQVVVGDPGEDDQAIDVGRAYLFDAETGLLMTTLSHPNPSANVRFGSSVAIQSPWVVVGAEGDGMVFVYNASSGTLLHELGNHTTGYGSQVFVTNTHVIVGSPMEGAGGRVYAYEVISGALVGTWDNPNPGGLGAMSDQFGSSLAIVGNELAIGAPGEDQGGADAGAVYVVDLLAPSVQARMLVSPTPEVDGQFGTQVAIDSFRVVVGSKEGSSSLQAFVRATGEWLREIEAAPGETMGGFTLVAGQLYYASRAMGPTAVSQGIHVFDSITLDRRSGFTTVDADVDDAFTYTLLDDAGGRFAVQGDQLVVADGSLLNFDVATSHTVVVQVTDSSGLSLTKALTIEVRDLYEPSAPSDLLLSNHEVEESLSQVIRNPVVQTVFGASFGRQVETDGEVLVTSYFSDSIRGSAFLFHRGTGELLHSLVNPASSIGDGFGFSVSVSGDRVLVGAPQSDHLGFNNGEAYLYDVTSGEIRATLLNPSPAGTQDQFGQAVSIDGEIIAISNEHQSTGRVELFDASSGTHRLTMTGPDANSEFGRTVVVHGDRILVGAPGYDGGGNSTGRVYLYQYDAVNQVATLLRTLDNPAPADGDQFGLRVAMDGDVIAIGAPFDSGSFAGSGRVFLFDALSGNLLHTIEDPNPAASEFFGESLDIDGDRLIVGSLFDGEFGSSAGRAFVFDVDTGSLLTPLGAPSPLDSYGDATRLDGNLHLVNAPGDDSDGFNRGRIYLSTFESGKVIGSLTSVDANSSDTFTYTLVDDAGGRFGLIGSDLVVANGMLLDFEANPTHTIQVQVTDSSGLSLTKTMVVELLDVLDSGMDFGDLPDSFGTMEGSNGARHAIVAGYYLGGSLSAELNGQPAGGANLDGSDDGVTLPSFLIPGLDGSVEIVASSLGRIDAFIDFSGDGVFTESERITPVTGTLVASGLNTLSFEVPTTALPGSRGVRVRYSTQGGLGPVGPASNGEVEDYQVDVVVPPSSSASLMADPANLGSVMLYVKGTAAADTILVSSFLNGWVANINGAIGPVLVATSRIVIFGLGGDDQIWINNTTLPGYIDGGSGNDVLRGGAGPDRIYGRAGNDRIYGRAGDDTLYGNSGQDELYSNGGVGLLFGGTEDDRLEGNGILVGGTGADLIEGLGARNLIIGGRGSDTLIGANIDQGDILVAGFTSHDEDEAALIRIREEWKRNGTIASRIEHLNGTVPGGLNGSSVLNASTVFKELGFDNITNFGGSTPNRNDWVFVSEGDVQVNAVGIVVVISDPPANGPMASGALGSSVGGGMNFGMHWDVNQDGRVSPLDALQIINLLNAKDVDEESGVMAESFYDVSGDGKVSPLDALLVINRLNFGVVGSEAGEGEGETNVGEASEWDREQGWLFDEALAGVLEEEGTRWKQRRHRGLVGMG